MQELFLTVFYFIFFVYLYFPYLLENNPTSMEERVQKLKTKATRISNIITNSPYFAQLCDWAYSVCDPDDTNHVGTTCARKGKWIFVANSFSDDWLTLPGKADLYVGILMVHIKLAKLAGASATFPPERETINQLFDACDTNGSGGINREEFDIFLSASSAQIFGRIFVNLFTYLFVIPYYSKVSMGLLPLFVSSYHHPKTEIAFWF